MFVCVAALGSLCDSDWLTPNRVLGQVGCYGKTSHDRHMTSHDNISNLGFNKVT